MFLISLIMSLSLAAPADSAVQQESDVALEKGRLAAFVKSGGASEAGKSVAWKVPASALASARRARQGWSLYVYRGIGLVISTETEALAEVKRRGGFAMLRGKVVKAPDKGREKGDPEYYIELREVAHRR